MATYIHGHSPSVLKAHATRTAARDAAYLLPHICPTHSILDVGCGPGTISADLAQLVPQGHLTCLDLSPTALASAQQTFSTRGISNASFIAGNVIAGLPFPDETFDIVHAHMVLIHLPDPITALREMRRVLKKGGVLACKDMIVSTMVWYPADPRLRLFEVGIAGTIAETGADPQMGGRLKGAALEVEFEQEEVEARASCWAFADREGVEFWGESCAERLEEGSELRGRIVKGGFGTAEEVDGFVEASRRWAGMEEAWFGCMNGEILARKS